MDETVHEPMAPETSRRPLGHADARRHAVHVYESDEALREVIADFVGAGLEAGEPVVVITEHARRAPLMRHLVEKGCDAKAACASGRLVWLDSQETLSRFMVDDVPDWARFERTIGAVLDRCATDGAQTRAYGDMVDVLWSDGNASAAIRLEQMWTELQTQRAFTLLCGYAAANFIDHPGGRDEVCALHDREVAQRRTDAVDIELRARRNIERALRNTLSDLHQTGQALASSNRRIQTIIDALPALVAYVDAHQRYRFCNRAYRAWFDRSEPDVVGRHVREVVGATAYEELQGHIACALSGETVHFEAPVPYPDGQTRFVEASYLPDFAPDGTVQGFVGLVSDITARKALEAAREHANRRTERLERITGAIANAVSHEEVFAAVVDAVADVLDASSAGLWVVRHEERRADLVRSVGYAARTMRALAELDLDAPVRLPVLDALRDTKSIWIDSQEELVERYPDVARMVTPGRSYRVAALPIVVQNVTLGALGFTFDDAPPLDGDQRDLLRVVARYAGQALERLRLLEAEATSRARAEALAERAALLSAASGAFAEAGHDLPTVLQTVVEQLTERWVDACGIALFTEARDQLELAALRHRDPEADAAIRAVLKTTPVPLGSGVTGRVAATGRPMLVPEVDADTILRSLPSPEHRRVAERIMPRSLASVPMRARDVIVGALTVLRDDDAAPLGPDDLTLLQELADRAGMAIESSRLYRENERERERAELLHRLAATVIGAQRLDEVLEAALDALARAVGASRASILVCDAGDVMRFRAWRGLSDAYRRAVEGHSPWPADARSPAPIFVTDVREDEALAAYRLLFEREGIGSLSFFPLLSSGRVLGKFVLYYEDPRTLDPGEVEVTRAIANHVAAAIGRFSAIEELQTTVRFNEIFTGVLGHDLRNPLGAIMTAAQLAMLVGEGERLAKPLSRIMSSGQRMSRMIDQLLDFTRLRVGSGIPLAPEPFDIVTIVRQVMDELDDAHPGWTLRLEHRGDTMGVWDADRLSQVFSNLVANAIQHGEPEQGVIVRIDGRSSETIAIEIHNGGAVPARLLPRLFEPMAGGQRRRDGSRGLGLGLYITREIVHAHRGDIRVSSDEDEGTTMHVCLPRTIA